MKFLFTIFRFLNLFLNFLAVFLLPSVKIKKCFSVSYVERLSATVIISSCIFSPFLNPIIFNLFFSFIAFAKSTSRYDGILGTIISPPKAFLHAQSTFFTDSKRGAVLNLLGESQGGGGDALRVISELGMRSWFREEFYLNLTTQKLGAFDPYMNEYVLSLNQTPIPIPPEVLPCGTQVTRNG